MNFNKLLGNKNKIINLNKPYHVNHESVLIGQEELKVDIKTDGTFDTTLMIMDEPSRNNALYPKSDVIKSLEGNPLVNERLTQKKWYGEDGHPSPITADGRIIEIEQRMHRIRQIDSKNICHRINSYKVVGNKVVGNISFAAPCGEMLKQRVESGENVGFSLRAITENHEKGKMTSDGAQIIIKKFPINIITFDYINLGGFANATAIDPNTFANANKGTNPVTIESYNNNFDYYPNYNHIVDEIKNDIGLEFLSETFNIDLKKCGQITLIGKDKASIVTKEGLEIDISLQTLAINNSLGLN